MVLSGGKGLLRIKAGMGVSVQDVADTAGLNDNALFKKL